MQAAIHLDNLLTLRNKKKCFLCMEFRPDTTPVIVGSDISTYRGPGCFSLARLFISITFRTSNLDGIFQLVHQNKYPSMFEAHGQAHRARSTSWRGVWGQLNGHQKP